MLCVLNLDGIGWICMAIYIGRGYEDGAIGLAFSVCARHCAQAVEGFRRPVKELADDEASLLYERGTGKNKGNAQHRQSKAKRKQS